MEIIAVAGAALAAALFLSLLLFGALFGLAGFLLIAFRAIFQPAYLSRLLD